MNTYEIGFHIIPTIEESEAEGIFSLVKTSIEKSGSIISEEKSEVMELAYSIRHLPAGSTKYNIYDKSFFSSIKFDMEEDKLKSFEEEVKGVENIFRYMIIKTVREDTRFGELEEEDGKVEEVVVKTK